MQTNKENQDNIIEVVVLHFLNIVVEDTANISIQSLKETILQIFDVLILYPTTENLVQAQKADIILQKEKVVLFIENVVPFLQEVNQGKGNKTVLDDRRNVRIRIVSTSQEISYQTFLLENYLDEKAEIGNLSVDEEDM